MAALHGSSPTPAFHFAQKSSTGQADICTRRENLESDIMTLPLHQVFIAICWGGVATRYSTVQSLHNPMIGFIHFGTGGTSGTRQNSTHSHGLMVPTPAGGRSTCTPLGYADAESMLDPDCSSAGSPADLRDPMVQFRSAIPAIKMAARTWKSIRLV